MLRRESKKVLLGSAGFTLIEMMVAGAIAAVLAAVAIPNFTKMAAVAREAEAKTGLGMIVTQEKAFYTHWGYYTACLRQIGASAASGTLYYEIGFRTSDYSASTCGNNGTSPCKQIGTPYPDCTVATDYAFPANATFNLALPGNSDFPTGTGGGVGMGIGKSNFSAGAAGNISSGASSYDQWTIKADKTLTHVNAGL